MIYVASSWRNDVQPLLVKALRQAGIEVYDFKSPRPGDDGFHWRQVGMPSYEPTTNGDVPVDEYLGAVLHPVADAGFKSDFDAMQASDTCILMLPCGRSAHLELGWFVGQGRRTAILLTDPCTPELMYKMVDYMTADMAQMVEWAAMRRQIGLPIGASGA